MYVVLQISSKGKSLKSSKMNHILYLPMIQMFWYLALLQRSLGLSSFLLIPFYFFLSASFISTILSSISLILSSASVILLFVPFRVFLISVNTLFFIDYFFLISSRSLLNILSSQSMSLVYLSITPFCFQDFV